MFKPYLYGYKGSHSETDGGLTFTRHTYSFKAQDNQRYIVWIDALGDHLYGVKFYQKNHEQSDDKFKILTQSGLPARKIGTCLRIMVDEFVKKVDPLASFAFIGSPLIEESEKVETKRYRLYQLVMRRFFNPRNFNHFYHRPESIILIQNRRDTQNLSIKKAKIVFLQLTDMWKEEEE